MAGGIRRTGAGGSLGAQSRQLRQADTDRRDVTLDIPETTPAEPVKGSMWVDLPDDDSFALKLYDGARVRTMAGGPEGPAGPAGPPGPPGAGAEFTFSTYTPTVSVVIFTGSGLTPRPVGLGGSSVIEGLVWAGGGFAYVVVSLKWGLAGTIDAGFGIWQFSLPAAYPVLVSSLHAFVGAGLWDDTLAVSGPAVPSFYSLVARAWRPGAGSPAVVRLYYDGQEVGGLEPTGAGPSAQPRTVNTNTIIRFSLWYRTA